MQKILNSIIRKNFCLISWFIPNNNLTSFHIHAMKTKFFNRTAVAALAACIGIFSANQALAQQTKATQKTPQERAKILTDKMKQDLSLTDQQYQSVYNINVKYAQKTDSVLNKTALDKRQKLKTEKTFLTSKDKELKAILTSDQYSKLQQEKKEMKAEAKEKMKDYKKK